MVYKLMMVMKQVRVSVQNFLEALEMVILTFETGATVVFIIDLIFFPPT
jgi:hypothetical protein